MSSEKGIFSNCLYYSTNAFSRKLTRIADEAFASTGLSSTYCFILMTINEKPGANIGFIADTMQLAYSTVTRMVERLEGKGFVERIVVGRFTEVHPTKKSKTIHQKLIDSWQRLFNRYSQIFGKEVQEELTIKISSANSMMEES